MPKAGAVSPAVPGIGPAAGDDRWLVETFFRLLQINGPSLQEAPVARAIGGLLDQMGLRWMEDGAGRALGGQSGNLVGALPATPGLEHVPPVLFCAHMDTVKPDAGLVPQVVGDTVHTDGVHILGADDRAGVAAILSGLRLLMGGGRPHGEVKFLFTVAEELGLFGAKNADRRAIRAALGYVFDSGSPVGTIIVDTPTEVDYTVEVHGQSAHSGVEPEKGISAIVAASKAIAVIPQGRLSPLTTANVGVIRGGTMTNIVPDHVHIEGEIRSRDRQELERGVAATREAFAAAAQATGARAEVKMERSYGGFKLGLQDPVVAVAVEAMRAVGVEPKLSPRGGGSDANILNEFGIPAVNLGVGYQDDHTPRETQSLADLLRAANLVAAIAEKTAAVHHHGRLA